MHARVVIKIKEMRKFLKKKKKTRLSNHGGGWENYRKLAGVHSCVGQIIRVYRHTSFFVCACWIRNLP